VPNGPVVEPIHALGVTDGGQRGNLRRAVVFVCQQSSKR
jgi:hypothetical protein